MAMLDVETVPTKPSEPMKEYPGESDDNLRSEEMVVEAVESKPPVICISDVVALTPPAGCVQAS